MIRSALLSMYVFEREVRNAAWDLEHRGVEPRLFPSSLGGCPRAAHFSAFRLQNGYAETHPFDEETTEKMGLGLDYGKMTANALMAHYGPDLVKLEVPVENDMWRGRIDILIEPCEDFPRGAIIEHKATSHWNFMYRKGQPSRLPYLSHVLQTLLYQKLYPEPRDAYLYYRCWNNWAQIQVFAAKTCVMWAGEINGRVEDGGYFSTTLEDEMYKIERGFPELPDIPYDTPTQAEFACTKEKGKQVACPWFGHCWKGLDDDPFVRI